LGQEGRRDKRDWEENGSRNLTGAFKGTPGNAKCVTKILGDKNKKVGGQSHGPRNDFIVGVAKDQLLPKIYKYAYTKMAPIEVFEGASGGGGGQANP